jgi:carbamoyl-phosphate synthase small subunit
MTQGSIAGGRPTVLELENGAVFAGRSFGADASVAGEVVFNTGMAGYVEALTDPSYRGQVLVLTYPLVGNYGVPRPRSEGSLAKPFESGRIQPSGLVVQSYSGAWSHHEAGRSLGDWLVTEGVPGLTGIDTRALTRVLREHGTMRGWIYPVGVDPVQAKAGASTVEMSKQVFLDVAPAEVRTYEGGERRVLLIDCGAKDQIVRSLLERGATVVRAPWHVPLEPLVRDVDGILIGNGPGDPADLGSLTGAVQGLMDRFHGAIFGVCLGHQILARAAGGDTYKLPYGHRGLNHPVRMVGTRRAFITSQNHGYAVDDRRLPPGWERWFENLNDGTNEGIRSQARPHRSVQFHPEASPGPQDTGFLFDEFLELAGALRSTR